MGVYRFFTFSLPFSVINSVKLEGQGQGVVLAEATKRRNSPSPWTAQKRGRNGAKTSASKEVANRQAGQIIEVTFIGSFHFRGWFERRVQFQQFRLQTHF